MEREIAVKTRTLSMLGLGVVLAFGTPAFAQTSGGASPAGPFISMPSWPNPALAQSVANALRHSGQMSNYEIRVVAHGGVIDLIGDVTDEAQRLTALEIARQAPGMTAIRDFLQVRPAGVVMQTQAPLQPLPLPQPQPVPPRIDGPAPLPEPMPIFQPAPGPNPTLQPPPLPPYAWPTVAPYNNYSRVAYPTAYPYEQWPFIGPMYPFPRVPLGWRSVSLTWEDGHWWFHRNPTGHDWWRIRYW